MPVKLRKGQIPLIGYDYIAKDGVFKYPIFRLVENDFKPEDRKDLNERLFDIVSVNPDDPSDFDYAIPAMKYNFFRNYPYDMIADIDVSVGASYKESISQGIQALIDVLHMTPSDIAQSLNCSLDTVLTLISKEW